MSQFGQNDCEVAFTYHCCLMWVASLAWVLWGLACCGWYSTQTFVGKINRDMKKFHENSAPILSNPNDSPGCILANLYFNTFFSHFNDLKAQLKNYCGNFSHEQNHWQPDVFGFMRPSNMGLVQQAKYLKLFSSTLCAGI